MIAQLAFDLAIGSLILAGAVGLYGLYLSHHRGREADWDLDEARRRWASHLAHEQERLQQLVAQTRKGGR